MLTQIIAAAFVSTSMHSGSDIANEPADADLEALRVVAIRNFNTLNTAHYEMRRRHEHDFRWLENSYEFNHDVGRAIIQYARCRGYTLHDVHDVVVVTEIEPASVDYDRVLFAAAHTQYELQVEDTVSTALADLGYSQREIDFFLFARQMSSMSDWQASLAFGQPDEDRCVRAEQAIRDFVTAGQ